MCLREVMNHVTVSETHAGTSALVTLQGAAKTYGSGVLAVRALKPCDLSVASGQFVVLLGPSGSGKTTFLNLVGGIERPTAGRLLVDGHGDLAALSREDLTRYRRHEVGFVFQFFNLVPTLTALENVQLIAELVGHTADSEKALRDVGLGDRMDRFPGGLSGGEQQRVAIARAVVKRPRLLLCDEPTGSLDLDTGRQVLALLQGASQEDARTVIVVTHNSAIAAAADRVIRMRSGEVVSDECTESPAPAAEVTW
jgi:putative ABC transport system ATP-binding protein